MKLKYILSFIVLFGSWGICIFLFNVQASPQAPSHPLPTCIPFSPSSVSALQHLHSSTWISSASLQKWDRITSKYISRHELSSSDALRVYCYLYNAQRDAAFLSYNYRDVFEGNLDSISENLLKLFFSDYARPQDFSTDEYSEILTSLVLPFYKERIEKENALPISIKISGEFAKKKDHGYKSAEAISKWIPWIARPSSLFWPTPPPSSTDPEWKKQITLIRQSQKNLTEEQKEAIYYWAGLSGPDAGDWRAIANEYLFEDEVTLAKMLLVRALLTMGLYDTMIAYTEAKYVFAIPRPHMMDPSLTTFIPTPNQPSYPSGHAAVGSFSSYILSYCLPENADKWNRLAKQEASSRVWAGVHFPLDVEAGKEMGKRIGENYVEKGDECPLARRLDTKILDKKFIPL